jgi:ATP-dependent helicase/nuclease subunit A
LSWYAAVQGALGGLGAGEIEDAEFVKGVRWGQGEVFTKGAVRAPDPLRTPPGWLRQPAPVESRPPRPLAPSALGDEGFADPPPSPALRAAAERGKLLHRLFERLPDVPPAERRARADAWLRHGAGVTDPGVRRELIDHACAIIDHPAHAALFGPDALAEAPIAAVVGEGVVVSGTVDRLLVAPDRILIADFKTARKAPAGLEEIPAAHLRQMAAYAEALRVIFPDRPVEAALLYTSAPILFDLPRALLDRYAPATRVVETAPANP